MSRFAIIENRGKTRFWARIADELSARGHTVAWIVQNPAYEKLCGAGETVNLNFPRSIDLRDGRFPDEVSSDRGRLYFDAGHNHYGHYRAQISSAFDHLAPQAVVGESTLFHELLALNVCRTRGIPYFHPVMARYPNDRFHIFAGDTQRPVVRSGDVWPDEDLNPLVEALVSGSILPGYMSAPMAMARQKRRIQLLVAQMRTLAGRWAGERYNTPSVRRKLQLGSALRANLVMWSELQGVPETMGPVILYPLQMQPECNIDIWGRPFSNQVEFIRRLLVALPDDGQVAVKANPKAKYEVSTALMALARSDRRVVLLPLDWRMAQAHEIAIGAVTVTGTVGYEAIFGRGRCMSLRHPIITDLFPSSHAETPEEAVRRLLSEPGAGMGGPAEAKTMIRRIIADSFQGTINEPAYDPDCLKQSNIKRVANALELAAETAGVS